MQEENERGTTIFLSSHILSEIQNHCNKAAIIREGKIIACDSVSALAKTNTKKVSLRGNVALDTLPGIRNLQTHGDEITFLYNGEIDAFIRTLSAGVVSDLSVSEPDLEEIFMHYYEEYGKLYRRLWHGSFKLWFSHRLLCHRMR